MKGRSWIAVLLSFALALGSLPMAYATPAFEEGDGSEESPYRIETVAQLEAVKEDLSASYLMACDLLLPADWEPIGKDEQTPFTGTFDADGFGIFGLSIEKTATPTYYGGVFGCNEGTVRNLSVMDGALDVRAQNNSAKVYLGGIAGYNKGTIENCSFFGTLNGGGLYSYAGGIVGFNKGQVEHCLSRATVISERNGGGIAGRNEGDIVDSANRGGVDALNCGGISGYNQSGTIVRCLNEGAVGGNCAGGITSGNSDGRIEYCYNSGAVTATWQGGGITGENKNSTLFGCFNLAAVEGGWNGGGIAGYQENATVENCYNTGAISADTAGGLIGLFQKGTVTDSYYLNTAADGAGKYVHATAPAGSAFEAEGLVPEEVFSNFDFEFVWQMEEGFAYPTLQENSLLSFEGICLKKEPFKGDYPLNYQGEPDLTGAVLVTVWSERFTERVALTPGMVSGFDASSLGTFELTVTYLEKTASFEVQIRAPRLERLELVQLPEKTVYLEEEPFDPQGLSVIAVYDNGDRIPLSEFETAVSTKEAGTPLVTVTYEQEQITFPITVRPAVPFADVEKDHWAYAGIEYCYRFAIFNGTGTDTFSPKMEMSRAMVVMALYNLNHRPQGAPSAGFSDVAADAWYKDAVDWAAEIGIVGGVGGNLFAPERTITRAEFVTLLYRYGQYCQEDVAARGNLNAFVDSSTVPNWATDAVGWAVANGLIQGTPAEGGLGIDPFGVATREQAATLMMRYLEI